MPSNESIVFECPFTKSPSVPRSRSTEHFHALNRNTSQHRSHQSADSISKLTSRHSQRTLGARKLSAPTLSNTAKAKSPVNRGFSFHKRKPSKPSGTILRAVPESASCATAPLSQQVRDMILPNQEIHSSFARISSTASDGQSPTRSIMQNDLARSKLRSSSSTTTLSTIKAGTEMKSFSSAPSPKTKGVIGTYKHGRVQWEHKGNRSPDAQSVKSSFSKTSSAQGHQSHRPRIQVVIPKGKHDEKPLPPSPFFEKHGHSHSHSRSASGEIEIMYNVSPPSGSKSGMVRDSIVSPLSIQSRSTQPQPSLNAQLTKPNYGSPDLSIGAGNSSDDSRDDDASSTYSNRSSHTSAEADAAVKPKPMRLHGRTVSEAFSVKSPVDAGIFESPPRETKKSDAAETGHRIASTTRSYRQCAHHPPIEDDILFKPSCSLHPPRVTATTAPLRPSITLRRSSTRTIRKSISLDGEMGMINQIVNSSTPQSYSSGFPSPTLSEAANDLEQHLTSFTDDDPFKWDQIVTRQQSPLSPQGLPRADSVTYAIPRYSTPPQLPRRSSKRQTPLNHDGFRLSRVPEDHIASQIKRNSTRKSKGLSIVIPETTKRMTTGTFILSPIPIPPKDVKRAITPEVAEDVIFSILENLESLDDLFACAVVNRGFYRVFKRHELDLMKAALRKMSPPAWEYREICYPGHDKLDDEDLDRPRQDYTPTSYIEYYSHDMYTIAALKSLIKDKCQSFMRPEISIAMVSEEPEVSARVDDALWRIWTFCKIFGSGKGREDDIVAQMDWLKGGALVHQQTLGFSALMCDDMNETLASAPECFAKGNGDGLSAEQLFDMMELWNCLGVLLQPIEGRTAQAREYGIYDNTDVRGGDIDGEELMLDEWYYYLLTLGLSAVHDLSGPCRSSDGYLFHVADENGWLNWNPPVHGGSRRNFLKEAASRVYEDKITLTYAENSTKEVQRALSKQRIQKHISELRHRKTSGERLQEIRMSQERPISEWEGVINNLTRPRPVPKSNNIVTHIPSLHSVGFTSALANELSTNMHELPAGRDPSPARSQSPPRRIVAQPLLPSPPPSTVPSQRSRSSMMLPAINEHPAFRKHESIPEVPPLCEHPAFTQHKREASNDSSNHGSSSDGSPPSENHPAFHQHPLQRIMHDSEVHPAENSVERAVYRIVEMGFTADQARQALRKTDLGDGLRVEAAVELLLREISS